MVAKISRGSDAAPRALPAGWAGAGAGAPQGAVGAAQGAALQPERPATVLQPERALPAGWGTTAPAAAQHDVGQAQRIEDRLKGNGATHPDAVLVTETADVIDARSAFSGAVNAARDALGADAQAFGKRTEPVPEGTEDKPKRTRRSSSVSETQPADDGFSFAKETHYANVEARNREQRIALLKLAFADPATGLDDGMEIARTFLEFVNGD